MIDNPEQQASGAVSGGLRVLLRLEGLALVLGAAGAYHYAGGGWWLFALLFLAPDLFFAGYLIGPRAGALVYNAVHVTLLPIVMTAIGFATSSPLMLQIGLIWLAHVGMDRAFGYGLKYERGFGFTHLGQIGKGAAA